MNVLLLLALAQAAELPPPPAVSDAQVERLTLGVVELWSRMTSHYLATPEGLEFFRRAGPYQGCDAHNRIRRAVAQSRYPGFRTHMLAVYRARLTPQYILENQRYGRYSAAVEARVTPLRQEVDGAVEAEVTAATEDLASGLRQWLHEAGLENARLGLDGRGTDFWPRGNVAVIAFICASPNDDDRRRALGWFGRN